MLTTSNMPRGAAITATPTMPPKTASASEHAENSSKSVSSSYIAASNTQHDQRYKSDADEQHYERDGVVFEPMPITGKHDVWAPLAYNGRSSLPQAAKLIAFVCWIASRMVASECQIVACDVSTAMIKIDSK